MENQITCSKNKAHLLGPHKMKGTSVLEWWIASFLCEICVLHLNTSIKYFLNSLSSKCNCSRDTESKSTEQVVREKQKPEI